MSQLALPIQVDRRELILGAPIVDTYIKEIRGQHFRVEVVGGRFRGDEFVYIIRLEQKIARVQYYCGSTEHPAQRFKQHERKWPLYRLTEHDIDRLIQDHHVPVTLWALKDKTYRRKHTFLKALHRHLRCFLVEQKQAEFRLLNVAKKHNTNGIIMAANQRGIGWRVARLFQADRSLEFAIKRRKCSLARFLPVHDVPF